MRVTPWPHMQGYRGRLRANTRDVTARPKGPLLMRRQSRIFDLTWVKLWSKTIIVPSWKTYTYCWSAPMRLEVVTVGRTVGCSGCNSLSAGFSGEAASGLPMFGSGGNGGKLGGSSTLLTVSSRESSFFNTLPCMTKRLPLHAAKSTSGPAVLGGSCRPGLPIVNDKTSSALPISIRFVLVLLIAKSHTVSIYCNFLICIHIRRRESSIGNMLIWASKNTYRHLTHSLTRHGITSKNGASSQYGSHRTEFVCTISGRGNILIERTIYGSC